MTVVEIQEGSKYYSNYGMCYKVELCQSHTGENLAAELNQAFCEWNIMGKAGTHGKGARSRLRAIAHANCNNGTRFITHL